jgi:hypothetical protein
MKRCATEAQSLAHMYIGYRVSGDGFSSDHPCAISCWVVVPGGLVRRSDRGRYPEMKKGSR